MGDGLFHRPGTYHCGTEITSSSISLCHSVGTARNIRQHSKGFQRGKIAHLSPDRLKYNIWHRSQMLTMIIQKNLNGGGNSISWQQLQIQMACSRYSEGQTCISTTRFSPAPPDARGGHTHWSGQEGREVGSHCKKASAALRRVPLLAARGTGELLLESD